MPFFSSSLWWTALALTILAARSSAQQCFFPDGTPSTDTPCSSSSTGSSCCASNAFCLDNGLCFGDGLVSRGSCTDKSWGSEACAGYCRNEGKSGSIAITPCATAEGLASTFVCGLSNARCDNDASTFVLVSSNLVLRPSQVSAIVDPILREAGINQTSDGVSVPEGYYTSGQMAGLGAGLGIPLFLTACFALYLWNKYRPRGPKLMYQLPDSEDIRDWKSPVPPPAYAMRPTTLSIPATRDGSDLASFRTVTPNPERHAPPHMQSLQDRYQAMHKNAASPASAKEFTAELDGQPVGSAFRFELGPSQRAKPTVITRSSPRQQQVDKF